MNGFLCLVMLFAGFFGGDTTDYMIISGAIIDGDAGDMEGTWLGLFKTDSVYELRMVELELTPGTPPLEDWERPAGTSVAILNETERPPFLVMSSELIFMEGPVSTALHEYQILSSDTSIILNAPGVRETRLFTTEEGLFLADTEITQCITGTYPGDAYSEAFIVISWAGDLDRDGIIDLIINDVDDGYARYEFKLYLSSEAGPDSIVRMVASFYDVYY